MMGRSSRRVPPDRWTPDRVAKVNEVFDLLVNHPEGLLVVDLASHLELSVSTTRRVVRDLRLTLGVDDTLTVITEQEGGSNTPCRYRLVGTFNEARSSMASGVRGVETRIETLWYQSASLSRGVDGRTTDGKVVRFIEESLRHTLATLKMIRDGGGGDDQPTLF